MSEELEGYLSVNDVAERLGRSTEQVRRYLREGKLNGRRVGKQWFIAEPVAVYRTSRDEAEMSTSEGQYNPVTRRGRSEQKLALVSRINRRREAIARRWAEAGIAIDPAELIREVRERET